MRTPRWLTALCAATALAACSNPPATPDASDVQGADASDIAPAPDAGDAAVDVPGADACRPPWQTETFTPTPRAHFPASFLWGSATAPYQIEGGLAHTDWAEWERRGHVVNDDHADNGPQSFTRFMADIQVLRDTHQNAYRMGIEWARLFPTRAAWDACRMAPAATRAMACRTAADAAGLAYYHTVLTALRAAGITPMVTVQHFSLPDYVDNLAMDFQSQGWLHPDIVSDLGVYAGFLAAEYGAQVDWWVTINEPLVLATVGYLDGRHPPGQTLQIDALVRVVNNMVRAHAAAYDAIHANDTVTAETTGPITPLRPALVSIAHHVRRFFGTRCTDPRDAQSAARADQLFNRLFVDAIVRGNLDQNANGMIDPGEPMNDAALRGRADYLGINYYGLSTITQSAAIPLIQGLPQPDENERGLPKTDFGWDIYPRGFQDTLAWAATYGLPVVVTENGLADATGANRGRFLAEHLAAMAAAMAAGANVVGYFHWSAIDNFEWVAGYCPRFGLYRVDFTDPARPRTARPGAEVYTSVIMAGEVTDALLSAQPAYTRPAAFCASMAAPRDGGM